jgi:hypothetical protein
MGTWGAGVFDDDTAVEIREAYLALLAGGATPDEATQAVLGARSDELADSDDGPVIWLALAATQWEYGAFGPQVLERALALLDRGDALRRWEEGGAPALHRRRVLRQLAAKLRRPLPRPRRPRKPKTLPPPPALSVEAPDGRAKATVYQLSAEAPSRERSQVICEIEAPSGRGGGHVAVLSCPWDAVQLKWIDADTLQITHPADALVVYPPPGLHNPKDHAYYSGRIIAVTYVVDPLHF